MSSLTRLPDWQKAIHELWTSLGLGAPPNVEAPWFLTIDDIEIEIRPTSNERQLILFARVMRWDGAIPNSGRVAEQVLQNNYAALIVVPFRVRIREDLAGRSVLAVEALFDLTEPERNLTNLVEALVDHAVTYRNKFATPTLTQTQRSPLRSKSDISDNEMIFKP